MQHRGNDIHEESILLVSVGRGVYSIDYRSAWAFAEYDDLRRGKGAGSTAWNADIKAQKELSLGKDTYKEEPRLIKFEWK